jgi:hypothetical protein
MPGAPEPTPPLSPLAALAELARAGRDHPDATVRQIAERLEGSPPVELVAHLLGYESAPGYSAPMSLALAERDRLLREGAAIYFPELPPAGQARLIATGLGRYAATAWLRDRMEAGCPYPASDARATWWHTLKLVDRPLGERQLRRVLAI